MQVDCSTLVYAESRARFILARFSLPWAPLRREEAYFSREGRNWKACWCERAAALGERGRTVPATQSGNLKVGKEWVRLVRYAWLIRYLTGIASSAKVK